MALEIPEEAIEAACVAMNDGVWSSRHRDRWQPEVDTILAAAAPLIVAAAFDWAAREYEGLALEFEHRTQLASGKEAVTSLMVKAEVWAEAAEDLRLRASVLRGEGDPK